MQLTKYEVRVLLKEHARVIAENEWGFSSETITEKLKRMLKLAEKLAELEPA